MAALFYISKMNQNVLPIIFENWKQTISEKGATRIRSLIQRNSDAREIYEDARNGSDLDDMNVLKARVFNTDEEDYDEEDDEEEEEGYLKMQHSANSSEILPLSGGPDH